MSKNAASNEAKAVPAMAKAGDPVKDNPGEPKAKAGPAVSEADDPAKDDPGDPKQMLDWWCKNVQDRSRQQMLKFLSATLFLLAFLYFTNKTCQNIIQNKSFFFF